LPEIQTHSRPFQRQRPRDQRQRRGQAAVTAAAAGLRDVAAALADDWLAED